MSILTSLIENIQKEQEHKHSAKSKLVDFEKMIELKSKTNLKELSMGMSSDYESAIINSSTFLTFFLLFFLI